MPTPSVSVIVTIMGEVTSTFEAVAGEVMAIPMLDPGLVREEPQAARAAAAARATQPLNKDLFMATS